MLNILPRTILSCLLLAGLATAGETDVPADLQFDAYLRQIGPQTNGRGGIWYLRVELDNQGGIKKKYALRSGRVIAETKVAMARFNEKEKRWEAGEAIPNGLYGDIFKDIEQKNILVQIVLREDRKAIAQILVRQATEKK